ncbi:MAG: hypothetical protein K8L91_08025 [Anaerolineae bacterium]|nr:MAG: hypothetical protein F9K46_07870 [Anaerolineae bacterium]MBZ0316350.1 hypothetical protein [Anaerolineae bacterium]
MYYQIAIYYNQQAIDRISVFRYNMPASSLLDGPGIILSAVFSEDELDKLEMWLSAQKGVEAFRRKLEYEHEIDRIVRLRPR